MRLPPELSANCVCGYGHRGITGTATGALRGSREVLPRSRGPANESTRGDGSQRASALVRATTGRTEHRFVDRGRHRDRQEAERKQKTDRQDAQHILHLLLKDDFPQIWVPSWENRDLRQLLWHRHRMVQARTRIMNQLQALALNEGLRCKKRLWREHGRRQLESFRLAPWASRRRRDLLELLDRLNPTIAELSQAIEQEAEKCPEAQRLMTHPGVGPLTALAFVLIIGKAERFQCGKQIASYLGLVPLEKSSGNRRRLGHITKQGSSMVRFLLVEAAQVTVRSLPEWRRKYVQLMMRRGRKIAKVAMARRLAVALYWMWRKGWNYEQSKSSVRRVENPAHTLESPLLRPYT